MFVITVFVFFNIIIQCVVSQSSATTVRPSGSENNNGTTSVSNIIATTTSINQTVASSNQELSTAASLNKTINVTESDLKYENATSVKFPYINVYTELDGLINRLGFGGFILVTVCISVVFILLCVMCIIMCCRLFNCYRVKTTYNRRPKYSGSSSEKYVYDKLIHEPEEL
ncbi:hypothetical protein RN001_011455 [Aquatica leii]|uniref:Uncharacterized protein n=1 Tax=Aquatica leii TaxID=1421715 RepID=A0AAN7P448_9COLE|nr:hypothetical protein RN001_011455 [Aquatica leii]